MFKNLILKIQEFKKRKAMLEARRLKAMYYEIRGAVIKFYEDKQRKEGVVDLPPFIKANKAMAAYVKTDKDIKYYYKQCLKYNACERV